MATDSASRDMLQPQLASPSLKPVEISFPLPKTPHTNVHIHLTAMRTSTMVFLSTTTPGDSGLSMKPMGSFVYAMPDRTNAKFTLSTNLYTSPGSIEYATRAAKILARRMQIPVYVGCNIDPIITGWTVEEEMEGFTQIINTIMKNWEDNRK